MEDFKTFIEEKRLWYQSIGQVFCPILNEWVVFNAEGFNHLVRKGRFLRSDADRERRFRLLGSVKEMIEDASIVPEYRLETRKQIVSRYGEKCEKVTECKFWAFQKTKNGKMVTVVIRQLGNGQKHFFSVMSKKTTKKSPEGDS